MAKWWTESCNPVTGCAPIREACKNCYAERWARRFAARAGYPAGDDYFKVTLHHDRLDAPFGWVKRRRILVGNMGDLFHGNVPDDFLDELFFPISSLNDHIWMILTKRAERLPEYLDRRPPLGPYVWLGVTVETQERDSRIRELLKVKGEAKRFISVEPMLSALKLWEWLEISRYQPPRGNYGIVGYVHSGFKPQLDWVQCGGETGRDARPMDPSWAHGLADQCHVAGVPFYFTQNYGGHQIPVGLKIRQIPATAGPLPPLRCKQHRRANSFTDEEIASIWRIRHLPAKNVLHLFPNRNVEMINHLRAKTGAYRIYGANKR